MNYKGHMFASNLFFIANILLVIIVFAFAYYLFHLQQTIFQEEGELYVTEPYRPAKLIVNANTVTANINPIWSAFAQGGEEQNTNMLSGTETSMQQIKPSYVRLDHIFDDDYYGVVKGSGDSLSVDWSKLDAVVASIQKMGAKPFFSLGYMPSALAVSKIDMPYSWERWQWLVAQCIEHYSGATGKGISDVYYEVWNEPDLESFGKWHYASSKNYLTLYRYSALAAKNVRANTGSRRFFIGGPAITAAYQNWVQAIVEYTQANNLPLDFVSWHRYSWNDKQYRQDVIDLRSWLATKGEYQAIISEFGPDSEKTTAYNAPIAGAHAVAVNRQLLESGLDWLFAFEVKDGPNQGNMGWGLLTHNQAGLRTKSRFKAYSMMQNMSGQRLLVSGEGSTVKGWATMNGKELSIIVSNYSLQTGQSESVPIRIEGLNAGKYLLIWDTLKGLGGEEQIDVVSAYDNITKNYELGTNDVLKVKVKRM